MAACALLTVAAVSLLMPLAAGAVDLSNAEQANRSANFENTESARQSPAYQAQLKESAKADALSKTGAKDKSFEVRCGVSITCGFLYIVNWVLDIVKKYPLKWAESFLQRMIQLNLDEFNGGHILNTARTGWNIVLGIVNMFFVLWLLWIAIATIFDFQPFTARSLLPKLIIAALLINFSFVIGSSFVRLTNGIGSVFAKQLGSRGGINGAIERMTTPDPIILTATNSYFSLTPEEAQKKLVNASKPVEITQMLGRVVTINVSPYACKSIAQGTAHRTLFTGRTINEPAKRAIDAACKELLADETNIRAFEVLSEENKAINMLAIGIVAKMVAIPISIFALFAAGIFLLIRLISIMLLLIFSPLAFLSLAIPGLGALGGPVSWSGWWNSLVKWSFYLPAFLFLFMISLLMLSGIAPESLKFSIGSGKELPDLAALVVSYAMGIALMIGSIMVANQMGIHSANTVTGWGKSMGGWAKKGMAGATGRTALRFAAPVAKRLEEGQGAFARTLRAIPGVTRAAQITAAAQRGKIAAREKDLDKFSNDELKRLIAMRGTTANTRAAALSKLQSRNDLRETPTIPGFNAVTIRNIAQTMQQVGTNIAAIERARPDVAMPRFDTTLARVETQEEATRRAARSARPADLENMEESVATHPTLGVHAVQGIIDRAGSAHMQKIVERNDGLTREVIREVEALAGGVVGPSGNPSAAAIAAALRTRGNDGLARFVISDVGRALMGFDP